jgi:hypothetical protein
MAKEHHISVDVYANWSDTPPRYRVYVDDDLVTERDFIYDTTMYIREHIVVLLESGKHKIRVQHCNRAGLIKIKNPTVDSVSISMEFVT